MKPGSTIPQSIDEYIADFPKPIRDMLEKMRIAIRKAAPGAEETIKYAIPTFAYKGNLVHFAAYKNHIGFYPAPSGINAFKKELAGYEQSKGAIRFPLDRPVPASLVSQIVKFRVKENEEKFSVKNRKTAKPAAPKTKSAKPTDEEQVTAYMNNLKHPLKPETEAVRAIIKNSNKKLSERIKWNAPSYHYKEDIVTFGPYKNNKLLLVFHHPAIVKIKSGLLEGEYKDRRLAYFDSMKAIRDNKKELERIMNELVKAIDKKQ
ncbi:MAG TPA: DUF1801 domain-containing protein [Chitinophagaceae bacterium]